MASLINVRAAAAVRETALRLELTAAPKNMDLAALVDDLVAELGLLAEEHETASDRSKAPIRAYEGAVNTAVLAVIRLGLEGDPSKLPAEHTALLGTLVGLADRLDAITGAAPKRAKKADETEDSEEPETGSHAAEEDSDQTAEPMPSWQA